MTALLPLGLIPPDRSSHKQTVNVGFKGTLYTLHCPTESVFSSELPQSLFTACPYDGNNLDNTFLRTDSGRGTKGQSKQQTASKPQKLQYQDNMKKQAVRNGQHGETLVRGIPALSSRTRISRDLEAVGNSLNCRIFGSTWAEAQKARLPAWDDSSISISASISHEVVDTQLSEQNISNALYNMWFT